VDISRIKKDSGFARARVAGNPLSTRRALAANADTLAEDGRYGHDGSDDKVHGLHSFLRLLFTECTRRRCISSRISHPGDDRTRARTGLRAAKPADSPSRFHGNRSRPARKSATVGRRWLVIIRRAARRRLRSRHDLQISVACRRRQRGRYCVLHRSCFPPAGTNSQSTPTAKPSPRFTRENDEKQPGTAWFGGLARHAVFDAPDCGSAVLVATTAAVASGMK
jgi:hypothetical protein